jgi:transaldolase/glucose-6-phosphate isomerase
MVGRENAGKQFVAITDPGSKMEHIAKERWFPPHLLRQSRRSADDFLPSPLSVLPQPAAMGLDVEVLLKRAKEMVEACRRFGQ